MCHIHCHPAYLTYMQRTSCKMLDWMKHKLETRLQEEISITLCMQMTPQLWQKAKRNWGASWWTWKSWLKNQHSRNEDHGIWSHQFSSVQSLSHVWLFATPWTTACQASLSITNSWNLPKLMSIELVMPSNPLILCHPLLLLPSIFPSIRIFSNESALHIRWPKYWSLSFNISPSNEHSGLISFRIDCVDLLAVQGTLRSLLQHHISKASILQHSCTVRM